MTSLPIINMLIHRDHRQINKIKIINRLNYPTLVVLNL
jgi:hypothetical protein